MGRCTRQIWLNPEIKILNHLDFNQLRKGEGIISHGILNDDNIFPLGIVRMPLELTNKYFALMSFTSRDSWCCDLGIPIFFSKSVYDAYIQKRINLNAVEATFTGRLRFAKIPLLHQDLLSSLGSNINQDFIKYISTPLGIPNIYIEVISPLTITFRSHNSHPPGFLWAINRETRKANVSIHIDKPEPSVEYCDPFIIYGFNAAHTNLNNHDEIIEVVESFKKGTLYIKGKTSKQFDTRHYGLVDREILSEFDARIKYFNATIPLERQPWNSPQALKEIKKTILDLQNAKRL